MGAPFDYRRNHQGGAGIGPRRHPPLPATSKESVMKTSLPQRMITAALVLEEVSALYGYPRPGVIDWSAQSLRDEAPHVDAAT
jgi:hypothetical protein